MTEPKIKKKIEDLAKHYASLIKKARGTHKFEVAWDDIRFCIMEIHYILESDMDMIIAKRYVGRNANVITDLKVAILSKLDFYRKIAVLEEIEDELALGIPISQLKYINNLRNALIHNHPKSDNAFKYKGGHIYNDLKFEDVCNDALLLFGKLGEVRDKIPPKPLR